MEVGGRSSGLERLEKVLSRSAEKAIDLSDSFYLLVAPTSTDFRMFERLVADDLRMIRFAFLIRDGLIGEGYEEFRNKLELINSTESVVEEELPSLDQLTVISSMVGLAKRIRKINSSGGQRKLRILVVCSGFLKIPLFHLALYLNARAIELDEAGYRELIAYPTWKLNEVSLAILYAVSRLEQAGVLASPQTLIKYVKIRNKMRKRGDKGVEDERSKIVSLDYYIKRYFEDSELLVKEKVPDTKRGVYYRLTPLGRKVAQLVEAHMLSMDEELSKYVDLEALDRLTAR
ncbi:MAG: hypothetical protein QI197_07615 [Candidatus Korarchaeota archaeon]|nr:hypothetical protein [Candidatus Korarchaeota archaeon]